LIHFFFFRSVNSGGVLAFHNNFMHQISFKVDANNKGNNTYKPISLESLSHVCLYCKSRLHTKDQQFSENTYNAFFVRIQPV